MASPDSLKQMLEVLALNEEPVAIYFTDQEPAQGFTPDELPLPTREREQANQIDWGHMFQNFSCAIGHIWRARRKHTAAWFSADHFGCSGAAFWMGFMRPQNELIVHYVSSGFPGRMEGEHYLATPEECRAVFEYADPTPPEGKYIVFQPVGLPAPEGAGEPRFVVFFARPESLAGLHQLMSYVTGGADVVRSPFAPGCGSLITWPRYYQARGQRVAVLGGWDPSARKYYKTDELSFTISFDVYQEMLERWPDSFLTHKAWQTAGKKARLSARTWGEDKK